MWQVWWVNMGVGVVSQHGCRPGVVGQQWFCSVKVALFKGSSQPILLSTNLNSLMAISDVGQPAMVTFLHHCHHQIESEKTLNTCHWEHQPWLPTLAGNTSYTRLDPTPSLVTAVPSEM